MEIIATGLHVPEGPALLADGRVLFTEQTAGRISMLGPDGLVEEYAYLGGSPNSCAVGDAGVVYACQNGGVVGSWRSPHPRTPGIQRVVDSQVEDVATAVAGRALRAPNDLAFAPDGELCFTDPAQPFDPARRRAEGHIYALGTRPRELIDVGGVYCNGIGFSPGGELLWTESYTRRLRMLRDGRAVTLCTLPDGHVPDGFAVAADGRVFVATCSSHGIDVVGPDGDILAFLHLDDQANPTNCCFRSAALIVTDFGMEFEREPRSGRLWEVPVDVAGAPVWTGCVPAAAVDQSAGADTEPRSITR